MTGRIGVLAIHGIGVQRKAPHLKSTDLTFSKGMARKVAGFMGRDFAHVAWHEAFWADILHDRHDHYFSAIAPNIRFDWLRKLLMQTISGAASYQKTPKSDDTTYEKIHNAVAHAVTSLRNDIGPDAPIVIIAHSLGGHIMSNYIYDLQQCTKFDTAIENMQTIVAIVTFGCNIAIFLLGRPGHDVRPITTPGVALRDGVGRKTWWYNYFDPNDILGYPLGPCGDGYRDLVTTGALRDIPINTAHIFKTTNLLSHIAYWRNRKICRSIATILQQGLKS
jgi:hypothetical protein